MNEADVVEIIQTFIEKLFPRDCSSCGRQYATLAEYVRETKRVGMPVSYDAEVGDWHPEKPLGAFAYSNCKCGSTTAISSEGMEVATMQRLLEWGEKETKARGIGIDELLAQLRDKIDERVLQAEATDGQERES